MEQQYSKAKIILHCPCIDHSWQYLHLGTYILIACVLLFWIVIDNVFLIINYVLVVASDVPAPASRQKPG